MTGVQTCALPIYQFVRDGAVDGYAYDASDSGAYAFLESVGTFPALESQLYHRTLPIDSVPATTGSISGLSVASNAFIDDIVIEIHDITPIPEPSTALLLGMVLVASSGCRPTRDGRTRPGPGLGPASSTTLRPIPHDPFLTERILTPQVDTDQGVVP